MFVTNVLEAGCNIVIAFSSPNIYGLIQALVVVVDLELEKAFMDLLAEFYRLLRWHPKSPDLNERGRNRTDPPYARNQLDPLSGYPSS